MNLLKYVELFLAMKHHHYLFKIRKRFIAIYLSLTKRTISAQPRIR